MQPVPCIHCGYNFMRQTIDPNAERLCNSCAEREQKRNPKKEIKMDTIDVLVKCPKQIYIEIEEMCINEGIKVGDYFINLHNIKILNRKDHEEKGASFNEELIENDSCSTITTEIPDKFFKKKNKK